MTADQIYDLLKWVLIPGLGALCIYVNRQDTARQREIDILRKVCTDRDAQHAADVNATRAQLASFQMEVLRNFVTNDALKALEERMISRIDRVETKLDTLLQRHSKNAE